MVSIKTSLAEFWAIQLKQANRITPEIAKIKPTLQNFFKAKCPSGHNKARPERHSFGPLGMNL